MTSVKLMTFWTYFFQVVEKGYYPDDELASSPCTQCPVGKYKDSVGSSQCTQCPPYSTTNDKGQTSIDACGKLRQKSKERIKTV